MKQKDEQIRRAILRKLYTLFEESAAGRWDGGEFVEELSGEFDEDEIVYNVHRIDGELVENRESMGQRVSIISIEPEGIEELHSHGEETILDTEVRYQILEMLYDADRGNPGYAAVSRDELIDQLDADEDTIDQNVWYLRGKGLIEVSSAGGGLFYRRAQITDRGRKRYEQYIEDGVEIPRTSGSSSLRQASIGPNESGKAENLFRDFVELARNEIVVIDPYAREPLYELLVHVPPGVEIKVITSKRVTGGDYVQAVLEFQDEHEAIEVRHLPFDDWEFHDRYVIRDQEDAWAWGHSFHDAGDTQHTASELKPVNRERVLRLFEQLWNEAEEIQ